MTNIVQPPHRRYPRSAQASVFLAGSIEMGAAGPWHDTVSDALQGYASLIYNPRRTDWDASWEQSIDSENFNVQVNWELDMIEQADSVFIYFEPGTKSPITLLELGIVSSTKQSKAVIVCPDGFWRQGNVEIVCERSSLTFTKDLETGIGAMKLLLRDLAR